MAPAPSDTSRPLAAPPGVVVGLAAAVLLALLLYALSPGLATTSDARFYLSAAASFRAAGQLLNPDGTPYTSWGPLYPLLLAAGGREVGTWALLLNVLGSLLSLGAWSYLAWKLLPRPGAWLLTALLALAVPWLITAKFVWAEAVFQALFGLYAMALFHYLTRPRASWLLAATVLGLLLAWQRTSGLFLLLGTGLGLLTAYRELLRRHWRGLLLHALTVGAGLGGWLLYAVRAAAVPELYRSRGWQGLRETLGDYGYVLLRWLLPVQQAGWPKHWLFEVLLPLLLLGLGWATWRSRHRFGRLLGAVLLTYFVCLIGTTVMSRAGGNVYDVERYAAVVYGPFWLVLAAGLAEALPRRRWVLLLLAGWLLYPAARAVRVAQFCRRMAVQPLELPAAPAPRR
ncbi:hypothetical protein EJV47_25015 [Hymenobacter gummosus]|uniref:Glycosyltransferase RgtA/B/C/D-like domain-containing protein n=1 Tax=Hymenobacter gummosus TaxID=1776032 RepID=A0A431TVJ7_9BACT|nr:hypothetical protein [Hymenobacter gummosus]RTQ45405.1 hypothetical protein EJV47_25015 [Hymenobacter gummosus]